MGKLSTERAPAALGPYSQAVVRGDMAFVSGQIPIDPATGEIPSGIERQTERVISNISNILEAGGLSLKDVVKTTVFLTDMSNFAAMNEVYGRYFTDPYPARSCAEISKLPKDGCLVEIECIAVK